MAIFWCRKLCPFLFGSNEISPMCLLTRHIFFTRSMPETRVKGFRKIQFSCFFGHFVRRCCLLLKSFFTAQFFVSFRLLPHSLIGFLTTCGDRNLKFRFGHSVRSAFSEEDFPVNFSQRKNGFEI